MFVHQMPEYIPNAVEIGSLYKVSLKMPPKDVTALHAKERSGDDPFAEIADRWFLATLFALYGCRAFKRGNLDAGRVNRLFGREIVPADADTFDTLSLDAELRIDVQTSSIYFNQMS